MKSIFTFQCNQPGWHRFVGILIKEFIQMLRDPTSIILAFVLPTILLFIYGFGISLDIHRLGTGIVIEKQDPVVNQLVASLSRSKWFNVKISHERSEMYKLMDAQSIKGLLIIPQNFSQQFLNFSQSQLQLITDGSDTNTAQFLTNEIQAMLEVWYAQQLQLHAMNVPLFIDVIPHIWFNSELESKNYLIPGSIANIMTIIGVLLTALVVAREWEHGTMEMLLTTPIRLYELILGKLLPYYLLGITAMFFATFISVLVFHVPFRGSLIMLYLMTSAFLLTTLALGLLISSLARTQFLASQFAQLIGFMPSFLLSGFLFEVRAMPAPIQWVSQIVPAKYFVNSLQTIFMVGDLYSVLLPNLAILCLMAAFLIWLAVRKTHLRLN